MTRIRIDLMDYDFEIIYKKGLLNTNADALSRIKLDSEILKAMIPETNDVKVITRNMALNEKLTNEIQETDQTEIGHLAIWECSSISDVNNIRRLKFVNQNVHVNDYNLPKFNINKKEVIVEFSDNASLNLGLILQKLILTLNKKEIYEIALAKNDIIFDKICIQEFKNIYNKLQHKMMNNGHKLISIIIYEPPKIIENNEEKLKIIKEFHDSPHVGGHSGVKRTINKIKQRFVWKNMSKMVKDYINNCTICAKNKQTKHIKEKLMLTPTPGTSFEVIQVDTVGPLLQSKEFRYILTIQCELTKYIEAVPIRNKEAKTIARVLCEQFILKYGAFKILKTDMGTEFINETMKNVCDIFKIQHNVSTPFHHETLGCIERNHRVLNEYLLCFAKNDNWDEWIPYFTFCYNTTPHTDTGMTPYELIFGKIARIPGELTEKTATPIYNLEDYAQELRFRLRKAYDTAKILLEHAKIKRKTEIDKHANPINVSIGDKVWLKVGSKKKLEPPYKGPYEIINIEEPNVKLKIGQEIKKIHKNRLKLASKQ